MIFVLVRFVSYNSVLMSSPFLDLLKQIGGGVVIFEPFRRDTQGRREFETTVHRLQEMERLGLIGPLFMQKRTGNGGEYIDLVMVQRGGLTVEGRRLLADQVGHSAEA